jgi:PAS domain S-box
MSQRQAGLELLVVTGEQTFGSAVADALEAAGEAAVAAQVETASDAVTQTERGAIDGVLVDDRLREPMSAVDRLTSEQNIPVVVLTDPTGNGETVGRAIQAGATDIFPRTTTSEQYELVVDRIASEQAESTTDWGGRDEPYREIFENASDGMVVHDPESGEILEVNEQYCEMTGFSRERLVGETVGLVSADAPEYSAERARERIQRARDEGQIRSSGETNTETAPLCRSRCTSHWSTSTGGSVCSRACGTSPSASAANGITRRYSTR